MIRIDLLPPEYRKAERTAPARFIATIGLVALVCSLAAALGYGWFGVVGGARADVQMAQEILEGKKPQAEYADKLEKEKKDYTERMDHIKEFGNSRVLWTKKIDQLASIIDSPAESDRHQVWLQSLVVKMDDPRSPGISIKGKSATGQLDNLSAFNADLQAKPFFTEFESITNPAGKKILEEQFEPADAFEFETTLALVNRAGDAKKPAPKAVPAK